MKDLGEGSPYFGYKKKKSLKEEKPAGKQNTPPPPPPILVQGLDLPVLLPESYMYDCQLRNEAEVVVLNKLRLSLYMNQVAHQAATYFWFLWHEVTRSICSPPGWGASPLQGYSQHEICRYPSVHLGKERYYES